MVTIRNDIEANGNVNRGTDSATGVVDGSKNINHLANGSRRSTMADIKLKAFNRKCVGLLALIVCVGVCFGVGMLFLYGHLEDRLNECAKHGTMLHDKNGNPVKPITTTAGTTTTTERLEITSKARTDTPTTTEMVQQPQTPVRSRGEFTFIDPAAETEKKVETTSQAPVRITTTKDNGSTKPKTPVTDDEVAPTGRGRFSDDEDDDDDYNASGSGSGNNL